MGNFLELVHHQAKHDHVLQYHLQNVGKNATNSSPEIQNKLMGTMASKVLLQVIRDVKEAKFLALMLDETPNTAHQEQVPFVLQYVD